MIKTILAEKVKMGQTFVEGQRFGATYVKAGPCIVTKVKTSEKDGYWAVQLGFGEKSIKNISKAQQGSLKGAIKNKKAPRFLREVRLSEQPQFSQGDVITAADIFVSGDTVSVTGISRGKGFAGVVKRWGFAGGSKTHGQSDRQRAPGSIGQGTSPGRVHKGKKMGGRMGGEQTTVKNLKVLEVDPENNQIVLSGPVPGIKGALLIIRKTAGEEVAPKAQVASQEADTQTEQKDQEVKEVKQEVGKEQDTQTK